MDFTLNLIKTLSEAFGPSGFEDDVVKAGIEFSKEYADTSVDNLKNLYLRRKDNTGDRPVVLLDGHSDEVGFMVQAIQKNGLIKVLNLGGWYPPTALACRFIIRNDEGEYISAIMGSKPPHFMSEEDRKKPLTIESMTLDIGAGSYEEVVHDFKISIGNPIVPDAKFLYNNKNWVMSGKAFDNRLGCAACISTLELLKNDKLNVDVVGTFTVQEERGVVGANVTVRETKPDIAIVFEGSPADDTFTDPFLAQGALHKGTQIRHIDPSMISDPRFIKLAINTAKKNNITYQETVRFRGSTNGKAIHIASQGIPTIVLGIPVRYAHTSFGYASLTDYEATCELAAKIIVELNSDKIKNIKELLS